MVAASTAEDGVQTYEAPHAGIYVLTVPAIAGVTVAVDGDVVLDVRETLDGQTLSVITALQAGPREIAVSGLAPADGQVSIAPSGAAPAMAQTVSAAPSAASDAEPEIIESLTLSDAPDGGAPRTVTMPSAATGAPSQGLGGRLARLEQTTSTRLATGQVRGNGSGILGGRIGGITPSRFGEPVISAPLIPPANVTVDTGISLTYAGNADGEVPNTGVTLFGAIGSDVFYDQVEVTVQPADRQTIVDVAPESGQFAIRLFAEDLERANVTVSMVGLVSSDPDSSSTPVSVNLRPQPLDPGAMQAMSRLTFGPTPDLYAKLRTMSFEDFVEEQLSPEQIDTRAFDAAFADLIPSRDTRDWQRYELAVAAYSDRQLQEVMGRFWFNHFHAAEKDSGVHYEALLDRNYFRENAFSNFADLLLYSARSPLMSQYLDNDESREGAINENYAREILELHTVGVNGGYTLDDIIAVARVFTGWDWERTLDVPDTSRLDEHAFLFRPNRHDTDDKYIPFLDVTIAGRSEDAGVEEGEELIELLANHPSTRAFVCGKIVQLLASDTPPASLVQACDDAWAQTNGEIEPMLRAILLHPDYLSDDSLQRNKVKTPFEFVVSVVRALGIRPDGDGRDSLLRRMRDGHVNAGENSLTFPAPTGLPEVGAAWTNSATFIALYREMVELLRDPARYGHDPVAAVLDAGLESPEEVASYLLLGTSGHYSQPEFEAVVAELKGTDGIFDPLNRNESRAIRRAMIAAAIQPNFHIQ